MGSSKHLLISFILCFGNSVNCKPKTLDLLEGMFTALILVFKILNVA